MPIGMFKEHRNGPVCVDKIAKSHAFFCAKPRIEKNRFERRCLGVKAMRDESRYGASVADFNARL